MLHTTQTQPARGTGIRALLAAVTLTLVVLAVIGIQSIADRVTAPQPEAVVAVHALATEQAPAATTDGSDARLGGYTVVVLMILGAARLISKGRRAAGARQRYWDDMPF